MLNIILFPCVTISGCIRYVVNTKYHAFILRIGLLGFFDDMFIQNCGVIYFPMTERLEYRWGLQYPGGSFLN